MSSKKLLILYSEVMPYNMACFQETVKNFSIEIHLVQWKSKKLTPYEVQSISGIHMYDKESFSDPDLITLAETIQPDFIFVSGWMDKGYLKVCKIFRKRGVGILCGLDNQWDGTLKQNLSVFIRRLYFYKYFTNCFVPGVKQYEYARRLGFKPAEIITGAYTANIGLFNENKQKDSLKKRILFVGRFNQVKGLDLLVNCFLEITTQYEHLNDWELVLVGNGPEKESIRQSSKIKVLDFMPQHEISMMIGEVDFFCLPSRKEPWGVVIHEMAAARLPLLLSDACGAGIDYLIDGFNGCYFRNGSAKDLKEKLLALMTSPFEKLNTMGERSYNLSLNNSPEIWSYKVARLLGSSY